VDEVCRQAGGDTMLLALSRGGNKQEEYEDVERERFHESTSLKNALPSI